MLKKSASILMAVMVVFVAIAGQAEARSNILNDVIKIINSAGSSSSRTRSNNSDPAPKQINFTLDGQYYSTYFDSSVYKKSSVVAEHWFTLEHPAEVKLHFIGHTRRYFNNYIYDSDANQLGYSTSVNESANDRTIILSPGRYVIKTKLDGENGQNKKDVDFEIKGVKVDIYPDVISTNFRRHDAPSLYYNTEITDYFPYATSDSPSMKYYKLVIQSTSDIRFLIDQLSQECKVNFELLDEDERVIDYMSSFYDNHIEKDITLNAGTYYLRAKRYDKDGGVYTIRIK